VPVSALQKLALPSWAMHVAAGANLDFAASAHVCHASSPIHAEEELHLCLKTGQRINMRTDQQAEAAQAAKLDGLRVCRIQVAPTAIFTECRRFPQDVVYVCSGQVIKFLFYFCIICFTTAHVCSILHLLTIDCLLPLKAGKE
jgi:hypothetical protein